MAELTTLVSALKVVRQRDSLNSFLRELVWPACGVLLFLALAAALSPTLGWVPAAIVVLSLAGAAASLARAARRRITLYQAALELDRAAALKDRLSTAFYFSTIEHPEGLLRRQRDDALAHLARLNPRALVPVRVPEGTRWGVALLVLVAVLFAYRLQYGPPVPALLQKAASSSLVTAMLAPVHAMVKDRAAGATPPPAESGRGEVRPGENERQPSTDLRGASSDGPSLPGDQKGASGDDSSARQNRQDALSGKNGAAGEQGQQQQEGQQGEEQGSGQENGAQGQSGDPREGGRRQQDGAGNKGQSGNNSQGQPGAENAENRNQSLAQTLMQALKNLVSRASGQQPQSRAQAGQNSSDGAPQGRPQAGNAGNQSPQPTKGDERGSESPSQSASGLPQSGSQKAGTGIGQQPGEDQGNSNESPLDGAGHSPDRVLLQTHPFSGEAQVRARPGDGTVKTAARNTAAPTGARVAGPELENVPQRYRHYLQRYFDQTTKGRK